MTKKNPKNFNKKFSAVLIVLLAAAYLLVTGAVAQDAALTSTNANIAYTKESVSYGDVWAFDSTTHASTSYNLYGSKTLEWYTNGGAGNTENKKTTYSTTNYFETVKISGGKFVENESTPMKQIAFSKFRSNVTVGAIDSPVAVAPKISIVQVNEGSESGVYTVVPGKNGTYYVHAYKEVAEAETLTLNYAKLDSCADTNAYAANGAFPETVTLTRIPGTNWYRGEISVGVISYYAASVYCETKTIEENAEKDNEGNGTFGSGVTDKTSLSLKGETDYYYNVWSNAKAYYDTVLVFNIPAGTGLGPIGTGGDVVLENKDETLGAMTACTIFGEEIILSSEAQYLPNMPIIMTVQPAEGCSFLAFSKADGSDVPAYAEGQNNANAVALIAEDTYVYYHENSSAEATTVAASWAPPVKLPTISVSGDDTVYDFVEVRKGAASFVKGTATSYDFTMDFTEAVDYQSGTYTVVGDTMGSAATHTYPIPETGKFAVKAMFDQTVVAINIVDKNGNAYYFEYTIQPVGSGDYVAKNLKTGKEYEFLEDALMGAQEGETITLLKDASFVGGNEYGIVSTAWTTNNAGYTIKSGVTLLVPFDDANTNYGAEPGHDNHAGYVQPTAFRTLTIPSNVSLLVADGGVISLPAKHHVGDTDTTDNNMNAAGSPVGPVSFLHMQKDSAITVQNGGTLYAWGFVTGEGMITVQSGAKVYENFQLNDFRGGSHTSWMVGSGKSHKVFPVNSYYIQNIEVQLKLEAGAEEYGYTSVYAGDTSNSTPISFIGTGNAFFNIQSGYIIKQYDGATDRLKVDIYGKVTLASIIMNVYKEINSKDYVMPLNSNMSITIYSGGITLDQDVALLPGFEAMVMPNTYLTIGKNRNLYVYDSEQWKGEYTYPQGKLYKPVAYAPSRTGALGTLQDAKICVNGTLNATEGKVYTTASGANVYSTENGKVVLTKGTQTTTKQITALATTMGLSPGTAEEIAITSAKLKNADESYTDTTSASNTTYEYYNGKWCLHSFTVASEKQKTPADCENAAQHYAKCDKCGKESTEVTVAYGDPLGHDFTVQGETVDPTCEADGYTVYSCVRNCGKTENRDTVSSLGHTGGTATCVTKATCGTCGQEYGDVNPNNHVNTEEKAEIPATCQAAGTYAGIWCNDCGKFASGGGEIAQLSHSYTGEWTFTETGHAQKCVNGCGAANPEAAEHTWENACDVDCECGYIRTAPHGFANLVDENYKVSDATCTQAATYYQKCSVCGAKGTETFSSGDPAAHADGDNDHDCDTCGKVLSECADNDDNHLCDVCGARLTIVVTWMNGNVELKSAVIAVDAELPAYDGESPTKAADAQYTYTFTGWEKVVDETTGNVTYIAQFSGEKRSYTITWIVDGVETTETYEYGATVTKPEAPTKTGYVFNGWDGIPETMPANDVTVTAKWIVNTYTVTWIVDGEETEETYEYGAAITAPTPTKENAGCVQYTFNGWNAEVPATMPAEDLTFTAQFTEAEAHDWTGEVEYAWTSNTCTATLKCKNDQTHTKTTTAQGVEVIDVTATCKTEGKYHYKATFTEAWAGTCEQEQNKFTAGKDENNHEGSVDWVKTATTHKKAYSCCGVVTETEVTHAWENGACSVCEYVCEHNYESVVTDPTCNDGGYTTHTCTVCSHSYTDSEKPATGHMYANPVVNFQEDRTQYDYTVTVTCTECAEGTAGHTKTSGGFVGISGNHVPGTCISEGYYYIGASGTFENCYYSDRLTVTTGFGNHSLKGISKVDPTCTEPGNIAHWQCSLCEKYFSDSAGNQEVDESYWYKAPTGVHIDGDDANHLCDYNCGTDNVTEHEYDNACDTTCNICGDVRTITHNYGTEWKTDGTNHWHECACGAKSDVAGHAYTTETDRKDPTCKDNGYVVKTCACGKTERTVLAATGNHNWTDGTCTTCQTVCEHKYVDGVCSVCSKAEPVVKAQINQKGRNLQYEDVIYVVDIFELVNADGIDLTKDAGLLVWSVEEFEALNGNMYFDKDHATVGLKPYQNTGFYYGLSEGIFTRDLAKEAYYVGYLKLADGTYVFSEAKLYSPSTYAYNMLGKASTAENTKKLCVALLNYISAAQKYFYKDIAEEDLVNSNLTAEQRAMTWENISLNLAPVVPAEKVVERDTQVFTQTGKNLLFEEMISIVAIYKVDDSIISNAKEYGTIFWTAEQFAALNGAPSVDNIGSGTVAKMDVYRNTAGQWYSVAPPIAPKRMSTTAYYFMAYIVHEDNTVSYSGVQSYTIETYINNKQDDAKIGEFAKWLYVYERAAKVALGG